MRFEEKGVGGSLLEEDGGCVEEDGASAEEPKEVILQEGEIIDENVGENIS